MNIQVDTAALKGCENQLLWSGALYGLKRLQEMGHAVSFDRSALSERQQVLLENEHIIADSVPVEEIDVTIIVDGKLLAMDNKHFEDWIVLSSALCFPKRSARIKRTTSETAISVDVNLDGTGKSTINTGLGFFDHMLDQISKHGLIDLYLSCEGDLEIDEHHTIEDVAIALGETLAKALGNKMGIQRYAFALPMDESKSTITLDLSGRPYLVFEGSFEREKVGDFPTEMVEHFFYSLAMNLKATLHISLTGHNDHHKIEASFKSFARCLRAAVTRSERNLNILPTTKDLL